MQLLQLSTEETASAVKTLSLRMVSFVAGLQYINMIKTSMKSTSAMMARFLVLSAQKPFQAARGVLLAINVSSVPPTLLLSHHLRVTQMN